MQMKEMAVTDSRERLQRRSEGMEERREIVAGNTAGVPSMSAPSAVGSQPGARMTQLLPCRQGNREDQ